jgi:hypothetical protein
MEWVIKIGVLCIPEVCVDGVGGGMIGPLFWIRAVFWGWGSLFIDRPGTGVDKRL